jgi:hypothetical protein
MSATIAHQIEREDGRVRLTVHRREVGFFYTEDSFETWDDTPAIWREGYPPSGLFATVEEAMAEARAIMPSLRTASTKGHAPPQPKLLDVD